MQLITNGEEIKSNNRKRIFELLYKNKEQPLSKKDIQQELHLSLPTISQNITDLLDDGLIGAGGYIENTGGRNALAYSVNNTAKCAIGVDITAHHITVVMIDLYGVVIASERYRKKYKRTTAYFKELHDIIENLINHARTKNGIKKKQILGIGVGLPGLTNSDLDKVVYSRIIDIEGLTISDFSKYINYPLHIINDANAACDIELYNINDDDASSNNGFYIMLSNNVGGAIFINRAIYTGDTFRSGEVGHLKIHSKNSLKCYCGQHGCVDPYCSATILADITDGNLNDFFELLDSGDKNAKKVWNEYLHNVALAVRNVRILFDCDIIIGGYVGVYIDKYLDDLKKILDDYNSFDKTSDYVVACKYKTEAIAAGAALSFIKSYLNEL